MAQKITPRGRFVRALSFHLFAMSGAGTSDVAAAHKISTAAVTQWCNKNRLIPTRRMLADNGMRCLTENQHYERISTLLRMRGEGCSWTQIARALGMHVSGVHHWINQYAERYPQLIPIRNAKRSEQEQRRDRAERSRRAKAAAARPKDWKLNEMLRLKLMLQSGYTFNSASLATGKSKNYYQQLLIRMGYPAAYISVVDAIGDLWDEHRPGVEEPVEYERQPRLCMRLFNDNAADARVEWHFDRWYRLGYADEKRA